MTKIQVELSKLKGQLKLPPSKSHTLRALLFGMMGNGISKIHNFLKSPDTDAMIKAITYFGAKTEVKGSTILIHGIGKQEICGGGEVDCGNSGILLRFLSALLALSDKETVITGDHSVQTNRNMGPLLDALQLLGVKAVSKNSNNLAPVSIKGPVTHKTTRVIGKDSQFVSALLILGAFTSHPLEIVVENPGEKPWIDLTLDWFDRFKIPYVKNEDYTMYKTFGNTFYEGFEYTVPADLSSAAFPLAAALVTDSELTLTDIDLSDIQGDKKIISILEKMGAKFLHEKDKKKLTVLKGSYLEGQRIDMNDCIDAICIMAVVGCFAKGQTTLYNAAISKTKECDRIKVMATELKKMGANITETDDGLVINSSILNSANLLSFDDHRIILALAVAGLGAKGQTTIENTNAITKTYKNFVKDMKKVNANIEQLI